MRMLNMFFVGFLFLFLFILQGEISMELFLVVKFLTCPLN
jgi:hypothetical protein